MWNQPKNMLYDIAVDHFSFNFMQTRSDDVKRQMIGSNDSLCCKFLQNLYKARHVTCKSKNIQYMIYIYTYKTNLTIMET